MIRSWKQAPPLTFNLFVLDLLLLGRELTVGIVSVSDLLLLLEEEASRPKIFMGRAYAPTDSIWESRFWKESRKLIVEGVAGGGKRSRTFAQVVSEVSLLLSFNPSKIHLVELILLMRHSENEQATPPGA